MLTIDQIRNMWTKTPGDVAAEIAAWDSVADEYVLEDKNNFIDDPFLRFMVEKAELKKDMEVLDVGCGAGAYSCRIAERTGRVTGVDFSPEMIKTAVKYAESHKISNTVFLERNWHTCDGREFKGKYDVVFAHTTPAVIDFETFKKMNDASRQYCFISKPTRRTDRVFDELRRKAGLEDTKKTDDMPLLFNALWLLGYNPEFSYDSVVWESKRKVEEAIQWYLGRLKGYTTVSIEAEKQIKEYLHSISIHNMVSERIETTLTTVFWKVQQ